MILMIKFIKKLFAKYLVSLFTIIFVSGLLSFRYRHQDLSALQVVLTS